jgi:hypothetical protein
MIADGSYKKMSGKELDITSFIELRSKNIDKEPLFDNPIPRI